MTRIGAGRAVGGAEAAYERQSVGDEVCLRRRVVHQPDRRSRACRTPPKPLSVAAATRRHPPGGRIRPGELGIVRWRVSNMQVAPVDADQSQPRIERAARGPCRDRHARSPEQEFIVTGDRGSSSGRERGLSKPKRRIDIYSRALTELERRDLSGHDG